MEVNSPKTTYDGSSIKLIFFYINTTNAYNSSLTTTMASNQQFTFSGSFGQRSGTSFGQRSGTSFGQRSGTSFGQRSGSSFGQRFGVPMFGSETPNMDHFQELRNVHRTLVTPSPPSLPRFNNSRSNDVLNRHYDDRMVNFYERQIANIRADMRIQLRSYQIKREQIIQHFEDIISGKLSSETTEDVERKLGQYRLHVLSNVDIQHLSPNPSMPNPTYREFEEVNIRYYEEFIDNLRAEMQEQRADFEQQLNQIITGYEAIIASIPTQ